MPLVHSASMPAFVDLQTSAADGLAASDCSDRVPPPLSRRMTYQALGSNESGNTVWSLHEEKQRLELRVKQQQLYLMQQQLKQLQQLQQAERTPSSGNNKDGVTGAAPPIVIERMASMPALTDLPALAAVASVASGCSDRAPPRLGRRMSYQGLGSIDNTMSPLHEEKQRLERKLHLLQQQQELAARTPSSDNTRDGATGSESQSVKVGNVLRDGTKMLAAAWRRVTGPIPEEAPLAPAVNRLLEINSSVHWSETSSTPDPVPQTSNPKP